MKAQPRWSASCEVKSVLKLINTATPDTTQRGLFFRVCMAWRCELSRLGRQTDALCLVCVGVCRTAQCDRRTHSDAEHTCWAVKCVLSVLRRSSAHCLMRHRHDRLVFSGERCGRSVHEWSYSTSGPDTTGMGDRLRTGIQSGYVTSQLGLFPGSLNRGTAFLW